jgi:hypothetical protein
MRNCKLKKRPERTDNREGGERRRIEDQKEA